MVRAQVLGLASLAASGAVVAPAGSLGHAMRVRGTCLCLFTGTLHPTDGTGRQQCGPGGQGNVFVPTGSLGMRGTRAALEDGAYGSRCPFQCKAC